MPTLSVRLAKWYLGLIPVTPPAYYENGKPLERALMEYNSEVNHEDAFLDNFPGLTPAGKDVLDIGCGYGGRTARYAELGAKSVTGIEIFDAMVAEAREFAVVKQQRVAVVKAVGEAMPFTDSSFDAIYSYDVFEHVAHLPSVLKECFRVLRSGGALYAIFPPVHHPTGGSHFHGYLSRSPAPNVLFRPKTLLAAAELLMGERGQTYRPPSRATDYLPSVNGTMVREFLRYVQHVPFSSRTVRCQPLRSRKFWPLNPIAAMCSHIPLAREITTDRIHAVLTR